jgi:hypothetical protein
VADPGHPLDMGFIVRWCMVGDGHPDGRPGPRWKPAEIWEMTLSDIAWTLQEPGPGTPLGRPAMTEAQIMAYTQWLKALTPLELLEASQRGELL